MDHFFLFTKNLVLIKKAKTNIILGVEITTGRPAGIFFSYRLIASCVYLLQPGVKSKRCLCWKTTEYGTNQNKMASKGSPVTSSNYQQKLESIKENGIINEVANDPEDKEDVFNVDTESETKSTSSAESSASNAVGAAESPSATVTKTAVNRKKSLLKKGGEQRTKPILQKRVSFSSVPSERRRRVSSGKKCLLFLAA